MLARTTFLNLVLLFSAPVDIASAFDRSERVAAAFCDAHVKDDEGKVRALLSPSLLEAIGEAEARNEVIAKATPDQKPPLGDGIPYQSYQDYAPVCKVGTVKETAGRTEVEVSYSFPDSPDAGWTDRLLMVPTDKGLAIDDILFVMPADQTGQATLRSVLLNAFDQ